MKKITYILALTSLFLLTSCNASPEQDEDAPKEQPKPALENAVEYVAQTSQLPDGRVIVQTKQTIYENKAVAKVNTIFDTLPSLGTEKIQIDDENSDAQKDTVVTKQYDLLFKAQ